MGNTIFSIRVSPMEEGKAGLAEYLLFQNGKVSAGDTPAVRKHDFLCVLCG
jgi:hypothetical protein